MLLLFLQHMYSNIGTNFVCIFKSKLDVDDRLTDINANYLTDEMAQMSYKFKDYYVENNTSTNIYIALFTTANARLRLYEKLDELGEAVIYCDPDSIVYFDDGENTVKTKRMSI